MQQTEAIVKGILANLDSCQKSPSDIADTDSLQDDLGLDSLGIIELLVALEDACGITISDDDLIAQESWMSRVDALIDFVSSKM
jgi:acyl carrier protein